MSRAMADLVDFDKDIYLKLLEEHKGLIEAIGATDVNRMYALLPRLNNLRCWMEITALQPVLTWCKSNPAEPSTGLKGKHEQWSKNYKKLGDGLPKLYKAISDFRAETCLYYKSHLLKSFELVVKLHSMAVELRDYRNNTYAKGKVRGLEEKVDEYEQEYQTLIAPPVTTNPPTGDPKVFDVDAVNAWSLFERKCKDIWTGNKQLRDSHKAAVDEFNPAAPIAPGGPTPLNDDQKFAKLNSFFLCELSTAGKITFKQSNDYHSGSDYDGGYSVEYKVQDGLAWLIHIHCDRDGDVLKAHLKKTIHRYKLGKSINLPAATLTHVGLGLKH